jgi:hypothetical protein
VDRYCNERCDPIEVGHDGSQRTRRFGKRLTSGLATSANPDVGAVREVLPHDFV